ncbi:MAG: T9SS type A sorting domain-containing protein [Bacteroidota bacterium]
MRLHYFGKKYYEAAFGECLEDLKNDPMLPFEFNGLGSADTLFFNGEHYFLPLGQDTIRFFQAAIPGFQWLISVANGDADGFRLTCESVAEMEFLGFTESVKTYSVQAVKNGNPINHALNNFNFELSKSAGFKQFFPFQWFAQLPPAGELHIWNIAGFDNGIEYTFQNHADAYFDHYQVGDVFKWRSSDVYVIFRDTIGGNRFWQGSITWVEISDSLVEIKFDRINYADYFLQNSTAHNISIWQSNNLPEQHDIRYYRRVFNSSTKYQNFVPRTNGIEYLFIHQPHFQNDEIIEYQGNLPLWLQGTPDSCWIPHDLAIDGGCQDIFMKAGVGIVHRYRCPVFSAPLTEELICLTRNGISDGIDCSPFWVHTAARESFSTGIEFSVFPNPVKNELTIRTSGLPEGAEPARLTVLQPTGAALFFQDFSGEETQIPTNQLSPGIYFLQIEKAGQTAWLKFLKQ